jgi:hypothetical protein
MSASLLLHSKICLLGMSGGFAQSSHPKGTSRAVTDKPRIVSHREAGKSAPAPSHVSDTRRLISAVRNVKVQTITKLDLPEQAMTR